MDFIVFWSVTSAIIYAMEHKTDTEKGCTSPLLFVLMPEAGLGEEAREGKEGKGAGRRGAIDFRIAGRSLNHYLFHLSHMCLYTVGTMTHSCISITDMTKSTHPCGCHGNFVNTALMLLSLLTTIRFSGSADRRKALCNHCRGAYLLTPPTYLSDQMS